MLPLTKRLRYEKNIVTRLKRALLGKGKFNVQIGQEVTPDEIIGTSEVSSGFRIINVAALLKVSNSSVEQYLQRKIGQKIYQGELLAYKVGGLFKGKKVVTSPTDGSIDFINSKTGEVKLNFLPKKINLPAAVYGIIESLDNANGLVTIKTQITRVHGIFGTGRQREGILCLLESGRDLINSDDVSVKDYERILVSRGLIYKAAISGAISAGVSGIITGGINSGDYKGMAGGRLIFPKKFDNDIGVTLVVYEGFGSVSIGQDILNLLAGHDQKFVFIDGNRAIVSLPEFKSDCMVKIRQTHLPPDLQAGKPGFEGDLLEDCDIGKSVRVVGMTYLGEQGKIIKIDKSKTKLASGLLSQLVTIETKTRKIQIPVTNIEII